jgi:ubiquitin carboxyl-terminal hydrolase 36/42
MSVQETTWIYALWGGKLLSRVSCMQCGANSDTYDSYLDLSIDVAGGVTSVRDGLDKFVAIDHLKGANKYKCEK